MAARAASEEGSYETLGSTVIAPGRREMLPARALDSSGAPLRGPPSLRPTPLFEPHLQPDSFARVPVADNT